MLRPPGQHTEGGRVRAQQQIRVDLSAEAGNGGAVDGDTVLEGPVQFLRHNGDIFLAARRVAEGHADELHVLLRRILLDLLNRILHIVSAFPLWFPYACPAIQAPSFFDATVIAHLFINLQYVKQKKIMVFRDLFSVMLTHWGLPLPVWSPVLFCALRRSFSNRMPVQAMLQQKRRPLPTGAHAPAENERLCSFCIQKN